MKQLMMVSYVMIVLLIPHDVFAEHIAIPKHHVGTLDCKVVLNSGWNLLIHSTKDVRCTFRVKEGGLVEYYKGETGIKFGIDINLGKHDHILYAVLGRDFNVGSHQLSGKYAGVSGSARFGLSAGDSSPIEKVDKSISLQPIQIKNRGAGAAAGLSYLYLEADKE